ncbi:MAG: DUF2254 domain-containing protein [Actinomycetota bacterium]|nr:DUF2254 domain-containing protein [Actinomycetota bacterium]
MRLQQLREYLRSSLWFIPALAMAGALVLSVLSTAFDRRYDAGPLGFTGNPEAARTILQVIATSILTFTAVVFTITIVVLQLASSQFSPRVLRTFLRDRDSQVASAIFVSTFAYALLELRAVRSDLEDDPGFVPRLSVTLALVLVFVSLGVFVRYIHSIAQSIRAVSIIDSVGDETRQLIERLYPVGTGEAQPLVLAKTPTGRPDSVIVSPRQGVVIGYSQDPLMRAAHRADCFLRMVPAVGDFVPEGGPLFEVFGDGSRLGEVTRFVELGLERSMRQDVAFGFRQLVDIAERALSPSINDPTTAVQVIDQLHDLLRRLAQRSFPPEEVLDEEGGVRLVVPAMTWEGYVSLAADEIRHYGEGSVQVARRLRAMVEDLQTVAPSTRLPALERQLKLLEAMVGRGFPDFVDQALASTPDTQGHGS